jgi:protein arginine kinase
MADSKFEVGAWLADSGPDSDVVVSARTRIARNIVGYPLKARLTDRDEKQLCEATEAKIRDSEIGKAYLVRHLDQLDPIARLILAERHLISLEHSNASGRRSVVTDATESVAVMVNEEDHLRIQVIHAGQRLDDSFTTAMRVHGEFEKLLPFMFHRRFGYLTSCPTNVGTGMRLSVMLHLPALVFTKQIDKFFNAVAKMNLAVRGFYGEGTKALSDFYQVSNQVTLGKLPGSLLDSVKSILPRIIEFERAMRRQIFETERTQIEDKLWRAYGILRNARSMASEEAFELLSLLRMGVHARVFTDLDITRVNQLFMLVQPGHLQAHYGKGVLEPAKRDTVRADLIREWMGRGLDHP